MTLYFQKLAGQWVVRGPAEEIQLGEVTVTKRNGRTTTATITRLGPDAGAPGQTSRIGYLDNTDRKTYRERREAKAERLQGWSENRQQAAETALESKPELRHDWAFITQPGRIVARERMNASDERAFESLRKAEEMAERAANIKAATAGAIYSDDADAVERLEAKIADLEAQRDRIKAYNASCRRGERDVTLLDERQQRDLLSIVRLGMQRDNGAAPAYWAQNIGGNITRLRKRLVQLKREKELLA